jgi:hypothetical protein
MKLLRPLVGYALYDHKTNDSIRRELQTDCILDKIDEYRRNWLSHLQRMPQNRIPLKSYHYSPQGKRTIGRPNKRWRATVTLETERAKWPNPGRLWWYINNRNPVFLHTYPRRIDWGGGRKKNMSMEGLSSYWTQLPQTHKYQNMVCLI